MTCVAPDAVRDVAGVYDVGAFLNSPPPVALDMVLKALLRCMRSGPLCSSPSASTISGAAGTGTAASGNSAVNISAVMVASGTRAMDVTTTGGTCTDDGASCSVFWARAYCRIWRLMSPAGQ
ncbi:hypothetical protein Vretifemale_17046 [Volvox reticuliferus]|nr:hypothetical protein Vretifemale_17046 [Volvox reticuliferus]